MAGYNMTSFSEANNIYESFVAINSISNGVLGGLGLIVFWFILLIALLKRNPAPEAFVASSGATTLVALLLFAIGVVSFQYLIGTTLLFALAGVGVYLRNKG